MADDDDDEDEFLICFLNGTNSDLLKVKVYLKVARYKKSVRFASLLFTISENLETELQTLNRVLIMNEL